MDGYLFVVTCRNVALGVYPTMEMANESVYRTGWDSHICANRSPECYREYVIVDENGNHHIATIVAVRPSTQAGKMV